MPSECGGTGIERWCPKCGADYWHAKEEARRKKRATMPDPEDHAFAVIQRLIAQSDRAWGEAERWGDMPIGDLRQLALDRMLVPGGMAEAKALSRGRLIGLLGRAMSNNQSPPAPVPDDNVSVNIPPGTAA